MADTRPLERQWLILRTLSHRRHGANIRELAEEFAVSQKSIRRDLNDLRKLGFSLVETIEAHGRKVWRIDRAHFNDILGFTLTEIMSLYTARQLLEPLAGTYFWDGAQSAFRKIKAALGENALKYLNRLAFVFRTTASGCGDYSQQAETIDRLMLGSEERRITFIIYRSQRATEPVTYELYPYGLVYHHGSLYLVAFSVTHGEIRHFKVDRMTNATVEQLKFDLGRDFDLRKHLKHTFGVFHKPGRPKRVRIRFSPEVRRHVEESAWHPSQRLFPQKDGSLVAEFHLSSLEEVKSWVLSFGAKAVVEKPDELRKDILSEMATAISEYGTTRTNHSAAKRG